MMKITNYRALLDQRTIAHTVARLKLEEDKNRVVKDKRWQEIVLPDYLRNINTSGVYIANIKGNQFCLNPLEEKVAEELEKGQINHPVIESIFEFYQDPKNNSAAINDLFLDVTADRAYGFVLLNMHTADIDVKINDTKAGHLIIRYNENVANTKFGWKIRCEYISKIFGDMGFSTKLKGGYVHMTYKKKNSKKIQNSFPEAMRGLASTAHLNLLFENQPDDLWNAVDAFKSGVTNVFDLLHIKKPQLKRWHYHHGEK